MGKRPYFIKEDIGDTFGLDMFLYQDMNKYIEDLLKNIYLDSYNLKILLQIFHEISTMSRFGNAGNLPIANYDSIPTWEKILRISFEMIERTYLIEKKKELFETLELTIFTLGTPQKVEYYSHEDLPSIESIKNLEDLSKKPKVAPEDRLRKMLIHYHDLYEGTYKVCLSLFHFLCDLLEGNYKPSKPFEEYLNRDDVSYKIDKISNYSASIKLQHNIDWLLIGADSHIRNAVAHKRWEFKKGKVLLKDRNGWSKEFDYSEIKDLIRSLNIANKGMQSAIIIGFCKYMEEIAKSVPKREMDEESIYSIMYQLANTSHFLLDDLTIGKDMLIFCKLKEEVIPLNRVIYSGNKTHSVKIDLPSIPNRSYRIKSFVAKSLPAIWNYKKIRIELFDFKDEAVGIMEIDIEKWSQMYQSGQKYDQKYYDSHVLVNTIIEDSTKAS